MNKIVSTKTTSAIFLAIVLITGTFAVIFPSFMIEAQAQSESEYYEMDNNYEKSYGHDNHESTAYQ